MNYRKEFLGEYKRLQRSGMTEEQIEQFYLGAAREVILSDDRYYKHNLPMYGKDEEDDNDGGNNVEEFGTFSYQRGSQRKKSVAEKEDETGWCAIKLCVTMLCSEDRPDIYDASIPITKQLENDALCNAIEGLTERRRYIFDMLMAGWPQNIIAKTLGISCAAVSKNVTAIRQTLEPYKKDIIQG